MAYLTQNMNQFNPTPIIGALDLVPSPDVIAAQIDPASTTLYLQAGSPVKLKTGASGAVLVDGQTGPTDASVFGVIPYNPRKNLYAAGDIISVARGGSYMYMRSSAAITRGAKVSITAATATSDPLVTTDTTTGHFATGFAVDEATAADQLIRVNISPSTNP